MKDINNILEYFINYEIEERLNNIELNKGNYINIKKVELGNIEFLRREILKKKIQLLDNLIKNIKFKDANKQKEVRDILDKISKSTNNLDQEFKFYKIVSKKDYKYPENFNNDLKKVENIINDDQIFILYPVLAKADRKIPLVCFNVKLINDELKNISYYIQNDALRIIFSHILNCELSEVESYISDYTSFYDSVSSLKNDDIFNIIKMIEKEIKEKFKNNNFNGLWEYKNYGDWAITEEIILTLESFNGILMPPYQKEIEEVKYHIENGKDSILLEKYLFGNDKSTSTEEISLKGHLGSYTSKYAINEKQQKILSLYQNIDLLAVNGPPGTGKTTVIKEIIANNIVNKTKLIIDTWNDTWIKVGENNQEARQSPLKGLCQYSMVVASGNNEAVDNIGKELIQEIEYFSDVVKDMDDYKGVLCARLGKFDNMNSFRNIILNPFMHFLTSTDQYDEKLAESYINQYNDLYNELNKFNKEISYYISSKKIVYDKIYSLNLFKDEIKADLINQHLREQKDYFESLNEEKKKIKMELQQLKNNYLLIQDELLEDLKLEETYNDKLDKININIEKIEKVSKYFLFKKNRIKRLENKYGSRKQLHKNKNNYICTLELIKSKIDQNNQELETIKNKLNELNTQLDSIKIRKNKYKNNIDVLKLFNTLIEKYQYIKNNFSLSEDWDSDEKDYYGDINIVQKRNDIFKISIKIIEQYIFKYTTDITFNLKKLFQDNWFQSYFRPDFRYNSKYAICLKSIWETIFLCFPVVTTTLYALDYKKFPMINEMFDTILIDEAGQSAIHTAVGPLYRFRKAIIVGDVFQLEPIHKHKNRDVTIMHLDEKFMSSMDIDENSIQHAADRSSDIYDMLNDQKVGIILNEHRRCEKSIVEFSNNFVYENMLSIVNKDTKKDYLNSTICMIDVRGMKINRSNESEVVICSKIVDGLVQVHGEDYKNKIGIITPYRNQVKKLKNKFDKIDCGTVHAFQGKEKEVIIISLVVDDPRQLGSLNFIGGKPNFLNVAFTRAKKQLIVVGNYETCSMSNNYLSHAIEIVRKKGIIYSLYEPEVFQSEKLDEVYKKQFLSLFDTEQRNNDEIQDVINKYTEKGILADPENHHKLLMEILSKAEQSIHIISPWIRYSVVSNNFLNKIQALIESGKEIQICFGYKPTRYNLSEIEKIVNYDNFGKGLDKDIKSIEKLYELLKDKLHYVPPIHSKILIIDNKRMILGSHNWLSNKGTSSMKRDEISCIIYDENAIGFIQNRYKIDKQE